MQLNKSSWWKEVVEQKNIHDGKKREKNIQQDTLKDPCPTSYF